MNFNFLIQTLMINKTNFRLNRYCLTLKHVLFISIILPINVKGTVLNEENCRFEVNLKDEFLNSFVVLNTTFNVTVLDHIQTNFDLVSIDSSSYEETPTQITMYEGGYSSSAGGISFEDDVSTISVTYPLSNSASGQHSIKMEATSDARCRAYSKTPEAYFDLDSSKSYTIEFKIWIDTNYTDTNIVPEVFKSDKWLGEGFWTSVANLPRGEWVTVNKEAVKIWSPAESGQYFISFRFQKIGIVYIDDIKIY